MSDADRVAWSAGELILNGGRRYKITAGNTYSELGNAALPQSGGNATQKVIIYFDQGQDPTVATDGTLSYKLDVLPATSTYNSQTAYKASSTRYKIGWAEYRSPKANFYLYHEYEFLGDSNNHVAVSADAIIDMSASISIDGDGITFNGEASIASDGATVLNPTNLYLKFKDNSNNVLGNFGGARISVDDTDAPWYPGAMASDNTSYAHYIWGVQPVSGHTSLMIQDMNRGIINNLTALSQSVHTQTDALVGTRGTLAEALDNSETSIDMNAGHGISAGEFLTIGSEDIYVNNVSTNTLTVTRGYYGSDPTTHANGTQVNLSWNWSGSTSGARQHVRIPPNNAFTAKSTQVSGYPPQPGWAYSTDIEGNGLGPYCLVLERSQSNSTGQPDKPWNTQWRQIGAAVGGIVVAGQTTVDMTKASAASDFNNVNFAAGSGIAITTNNSTKTVTFATSSSVRYKEDITPLVLDSTKIYDLKPRSFTWKSDAPNFDQGKSDYGLVAEEVAEVFPELTFDNEREEVEGVKYITLSVLLLEEMKKLRKRIEELEAKE